MTITKEVTVAVDGEMESTDIYPCRCGETHRGEYAAETYAQHTCFHATALIWLEYPDEAMCMGCGKVFAIDAGDKLYG